MGPDGKKLSKRHGDTAVAAYRSSGHLPEALVNYLALLGWNPGEDDTVLPLEEMERRFDLGVVSKNPAIFDTDKLEWMNGVYIRELSAEQFVGSAIPWIENDLGRPLDVEERTSIVAIAPHVQERAKLMTEVPGQVKFLLIDAVEFDETSWRKVMSKDEVPDVLDAAAAALKEVETWDTASIEAALRSMLSERELSARRGLQPIRVAISGSSVSPPLFESLEVLGRDETLVRLTRARDLASE
jgi:glutamyl-tRNA synthetase